jgi:hypothetical protein
MATKKLSVFETLNKINVNEFKEKKGNYDYLSWSDAVQYVLSEFPDATWETHEFDVPMNKGEDFGWHKCPYMITDSGCFVKVSVTIEGITRTEVHAVMDNYNKAIKEPTATQINNSIKRCLVKCFALFGLGLYIYRGEDLPEDDKPQEISKEQYDYLMTLLEGRDKAFVESIEVAIRSKKLNTNNFDGYVEQLQKKKPKKEVKNG